MNKIEAIQNIKKVGKFVDCQAAGSQFQDNTIIYGRNTLGKSTLTAIFRSIQTGDKKIIEGKKTSAGARVSLVPKKNEITAQDTALSADRQACASGCHRRAPVGTHRNDHKLFA